MFCHLYYFEKIKGAVLNLQGCKHNWWFTCCVDKYEWCKIKYLYLDI